MVAAAAAAAAQLAPKECHSFSPCSSPFHAGGACSAGGLKKLCSFDLFPCIYAQSRPAETTICMGIGLEEGLDYCFYYFFVINDMSL